MSLLANGAFTISSSIEQKWLIPFSALLLVDALGTAFSRKLPVAEAIVLFVISKSDDPKGCHIDAIANNAIYISGEKGAFVPINIIFDAIENLNKHGILAVEDQHFFIAEKVYIKETLL